MTLDREFWRDVLKTAFGIIVGVGAVAGLAALFYRVLQSSGITVSYTGLTREEVLAVAREMDSRAQILSRVQGGDERHTFIRGIYLGGATTFPIYYRYDFWGDGRAGFKIYPLLWSELWSTSPDFLGQTGELIFPKVARP